ncbi:MAG TPA: hypothetical protein VGJ26_13550 [Pirellulales bacterium]|jgi:hypothetical protein
MGDLITRADESYTRYVIRRFQFWSWAFVGLMMLTLYVNPPTYQRVLSVRDGAFAAIFLCLLALAAQRFVRYKVSRMSLSRNGSRLVIQTFHDDYEFDFSLADESSLRIERINARQWQISDITGAKLRVSAMAFPSLDEIFNRLQNVVREGRSR